MKRVLITGGAGFIGSTIALKLIDGGCSVRVFDSLSAQIHGSDPGESFLYERIKDKCEFVRGDVRDRAALINALRDTDYVLHLAAETGTGQSMYEIEKYCSVNIGGTATLVDILANKEARIEKLVLASSRAIYGEGKYRCREHGIRYPDCREDGSMLRGEFDPCCPECGKVLELLPTDEKSRIAPTSIYGITKQVQEELVRVACNEISLSWVVLRYQNVYGPGQSLVNPYTGILSVFSTKLKKNLEINIFEDGKESRDFIYIDDVADATIQAMKSETANNSVFNVGSGRGTTVLEIAELLKTAYKSSSEMKVSGNYRIGDIRHNIADITKIKAHIGFEPKVPIETGINRFAAWVMKSDVETDDGYEKSLDEMRSKGLLK